MHIDRIPVYRVYQRAIDLELYHAFAELVVQTSQDDTARRTYRQTRAMQIWQVARNVWRNCIACRADCKPSWGACGARNPAYSRCVLLSAAYSFVFSPSLQKSAKKIVLFSLFCILHA